MRRLSIFVLLLLAARATPAAAQRTVDWDTRFLFYADNTEFFSPYREGATWLGGRLFTELSYRATPKVEVRLGITADHLSGDTTFADTRPLISMRYHGTHGTGVLGTLITEDRHGLLEPLEVLQFDILRPVEYGGQWIERRDHWGGEWFLNWRRLNTPTQREEFDMGLLAHADPLPWLRASGQYLWVHRGGQLFGAGETVANGRTSAVGLIAHDTLGPLGAATLEGWFLSSGPGWLDSLPTGTDAQGTGSLFRASMKPWPSLTFSGVIWMGRGYNAFWGDPNYNSIGLKGHYRKERFYSEVGMNKVWLGPAGVSFEAQVRFHKEDRYDTESLSWAPWEYSYRFIGKVPFSTRVWTERTP
jgi:hypothetical protein